MTLLFTASGCAPFARHMGAAIATGIIRGAMTVAVHAALSGPHKHQRQEPEQEESDETACERSLRMWMEVEQPEEGVEPPPELRCDPDGEYPPAPAVAKNAKPAPL